MRWGYIAYCVGYYTTLEPVGVGKEVAARFNKVLIPFEQAKENRHILAWGKGFGERGVQMEGWEIEKFKKVARVLDCYGFCAAGGLHDFREAVNAVQSLSPELEKPLEKIAGTVGLSELESKFRDFGVYRRVA